ncbi:uncharacterized protein LOC108667549 isoform X1 [Hyalella azteca]|uniref:Uncharacterized protein LOC108667549 isoform X1 n=1 Tax=Hyalella azteca TaxID=294128 RepID=A0A8B7N9P6_HYAAZ|nr:uncharacterized protein LOC108667549 isoform X1 [Hyalella azteca]XP_018010079.1 uncharacterized protein LOC108667549 isoform X1 [Hyalella azteca]
MKSEDAFVMPEDVRPVEEPALAVDHEAEAAEAERQVCHDKPQNPWPHLEDFFVFKSVDERNANLMFFQCVLCQPKETTIKGHASSLYNLKSHVKRNHPAHAIQFEERIKAGSSRGKHRQSSCSSSRSSSLSSQPPAKKKCQLAQPSIGEAFDRSAAGSGVRELIRLSRDDGTCASGSGSASQSAMWECHNPTIDMECSNNGDMETENMDTGYYLPAEAILKEPKVETNCQYGSVLQDVLSFVKSLQHSNDVRDEFSIFGEHIAARLRKIRDSRIRLLAQHRIHCALFDVEIDELNNYNLSNKQLNSQNACNTQVEHSEPIAGENFATSQKEEVLAMTDSSLSATPSQPPNREPELEVEKEASSISPENTSNEDHVTNESSDEK